MSFQTEGQTTAKARCWDMEVSDKVTEDQVPQQSEEDEKNDQRVALHIKSHGYLGAKPC